MTIEDDEMLVSFDVISLFTNVPVNLALKIIKEKWSIIEKYTQIPETLFMNMLTLCIKDTRYFKYDDKVFEQLKGLPMGCPASPVIADIVMEELLKESIAKMTKMAKKPKILTKYVDDMFAIIKKEVKDEMLAILNSFNRQLQFTMEEETNNELPYLDAKIIKENKLLKIDWYQKQTSSGRLINFYSKHPKNIIINTAINFIKRTLNISDKEYHDKNLEIIRLTLTMNDFPKKTIEDLIDRAQENKKHNVESKQPKIYKSFTYIPGFSEKLKHSNIIDKNKYTMAFRTDNNLNKLFSKTKSKIPDDEKSNLVYEIPCGGDGTDICQRVYVGTTGSKLKTRLANHKSDQKARNRPLEQKTALAAHCTVTNHKPIFEKTKILKEINHTNKRYLMEVLCILDTPKEKILNFKRDTNQCAKIYHNIVEKYRKSN